MTSTSWPGATAVTWVTPGLGWWLWPRARQSLTTGTPRPCSTTSSRWQGQYHQHHHHHIISICSFALKICSLLSSLYCQFIVIMIVIHHDCYHFIVIICNCHNFYSLLSSLLGSSHHHAQWHQEQNQEVAVHHHPKVREVFKNKTKLLNELRQYD